MNLETKLSSAPELEAPSARRMSPPADHPALEAVRSAHPSERRRASLFTYCAGLVVCLSLLAPFGCKRQTHAAPATQKIGVLLVSHGSRSETWRKSLTELGDRVRGPILADGRIKDVKSAFMEYTEPSIATRLKEFDREGYTDVVVVPIFLTVSPHPFDDIPTIMGQKTDPQSLETIKLEGIEQYTPRARTHITPLLDFTDLLQKNVLRRAKSLSKDPAKEGLVLIAYGDETYEKEWAALFDKVGTYVDKGLGIGTYSYGWCGHLVHYDSGKTTEAIRKVLASRERALVIPVLVAVDERFQIKIIGDGVDRLGADKARVTYRPDSILPDAGLEQWVKDVTRDFVGRIATANGRDNQ